MGEVGFIIIIATIGLSYYLLFKEHHKRNEMKFSEIYPLFIEYAVMSVISILLLVFGMGSVINGYTNNDEIVEVIKELTVGLVTICLVILHFIFWIKKHRIDLDFEVREVDEKRTSNIAEWIEIIIFILVIIGSIFNIVKYIQFIDEVVKYKQLSISVLCIIASVILIRNLNPLNINKKIKEILKSKK
ncbi:MAG: hypothetical protein K1W33_06245 [Clostridia bacterium]|nr:hypothetical protein [Clostridia bacterium]